LFVMWYRARTEEQSMTGPLLSLLQSQWSFHHLKIVSINHETEFYDVKQTPLFRVVTTGLTDLRNFDGFAFSLTWVFVGFLMLQNLHIWKNSNKNHNNNKKSCSIMLYLIIFSFLPMLVGLTNKGRNGQCMKHAVMRRVYSFIQKTWRRWSLGGGT
jgi:hypothetical protein